MADTDKPDEYPAKYATEVLIRAHEFIGSLLAAGNAEAIVSGVKKLAKGGFVAPLKDARVPSELADDFGEALPKWPVPEKVEDVLNTYKQYELVAKRRKLSDGEKAELGKLVEAVQILLAQNG
ncbi:hypothetical protein [Frigoriglobus tundricola]|uniref:Uncharacterized protein n=1 Tax=Frigoriglobus tundricola TaxID=2774151 RepID=A0A6M5YIW2_9BACT|nr:hypothetical protein [Frigoriglobus tundricola]QJW93270.1 hypothetical protein FTUN_0775 [Frigoriglobus tundricola]